MPENNRKGVLIGPNTANKLLRMSRQTGANLSSQAPASLMSFSFFEGELKEDLKAWQGWAGDESHVEIEADCDLYIFDHNAMVESEELRHDEIYYKLKGEPYQKVVSGIVGLGGVAGDYVAGCIIHGQYRVLWKQNPLIKARISAPEEVTDPDQRKEYRLREGADAAWADEVFLDPSDSKWKLPEDFISEASVELSRRVEIYPDPGFRGVAFYGDDVEAYFHPFSGRWQALSGGRVVVEAIAEENLGGPTAPNGGDARAMDANGPLIGIAGIALPVSQGQVFKAVFVSPAPLDSGYELASPIDSLVGGWYGIGELNLGCGLKYQEYDPMDPESEYLTSVEIDGETLAGPGIDWEADYCRFAVALDCADVKELITAGPGIEIDEYCQVSVGQLDCSNLTTAIPCCDTICSRLDTIEDRLDVIEEIIEYLLQCCEDNKACCEYNTLCCEYLDARVDYCCGPGLPGPGKPGGGPECGRCVWEWNSAEEEPTLVESCSGGVDCDCAPPTTFDVPGIYFTDCFPSGCGIHDCIYQFVDGFGWTLLDDNCAEGCECPGPPTEAGENNEIRSIPCKETS